MDLGAFDCQDEDLNEFLKKDAFSYQKNGIAQTYVCQYSNQPVGFFSLCSDAIKLSDLEEIAEFGVDKTHQDYPAIKIARLATSASYKGRHIGMFMVKYVIGMALEFSKKIGCRFVTVDSMPNSVEFYQRLNFIKNLKDHSGKMESMRFDLIEPPTSSVASSP
ncbi:TPA: GNAT family N-acetyltransferase [Candidatus Micrarchaeota archaeon]|nr:GNAT family N-acetyltransferase [Candidatus Micrarchaeota archaeon]